MEGNGAESCAPLGRDASGIVGPVGAPLPAVEASHRLLSLAPCGAEDYRLGGVCASIMASPFDPAKLKRCNDEISGSQTRADPTAEIEPFSAPVARRAVDVPQIGRVFSVAGS